MARLGSRWRILAHGRKGPVRLYSRNYRPRGSLGELPDPQAPHESVFDELVIDDFFHVEQMDTRTWWVRIGDEMLMFTVGRDGKVKRGEWYR